MITVPACGHIEHAFDVAGMQGEIMVPARARRRRPMCFDEHSTRPSGLAYNPRFRTVVRVADQHVRVSLPERPDAVQMGVLCESRIRQGAGRQGDLRGILKPFQGTVDLPLVRGPCAEDYRQAAVGCVPEQPLMCNIPRPDFDEREAEVAGQINTVLIPAGSEQEQTRLVAVRLQRCKIVSVEAVLGEIVPLPLRLFHTLPVGGCVRCDQGFPAEDLYFHSPEACESCGKGHVFRRGQIVDPADFGDQPEVCPP